MRLKDKTALITGSAQGIGKAIAKLFLSEGAKLFLCDLDAGLLETTAKELDPSGGRVAVSAGNVVKKEDAEAAVEKAVKTFGRVDILINNAGITKDNLLMRMSDEEWDAVLNVNLKGAFNFARACARPMMKQRWGRIINIASVVGQFGNAGQANYAASKGGLIAMTKAIAKELATRNVLCNAVAPGFIRTRMTENLPEEIKKFYLTAIPMGRFGEAEEIAKVCLFLASDDISYVTGQVIGVNGGFYM
ncbi:MAG: 3-oxoacyl-[acyl-carrier-protein] reductase [Elusimicrobia bacterium]|nr:3-oxoacyl-[acyl-carrier-protein] reductase [Elusimicrobiota bacterium]